MLREHFLEPLREPFNEVWRAARGLRGFSPDSSRSGVACLRMQWGTWVAVRGRPTVLSGPAKVDLRQGDCDYARGRLLPDAPLEQHRLTMGSEVGPASLTSGVARARATMAAERPDYRRLVSALQRTDAGRSAPSGRNAPSGGNA